MHRAATKTVAEPSSGHMLGLMWPHAAFTAIPFVVAAAIALARFGRAITLEDCVVLFAAVAAAIPM